MGREVERKFIVVNDQWRRYEDRSKSPERMIQGYLTDNDTLVRVRLSTDTSTGKESAILAIKDPRKPDSDAIDRNEWPATLERGVEAAKEILASKACRYQLEKVRHHISFGGREWSVDQFTDPKYLGLTIAEVEFKEGENPTDLKEEDLPPFTKLKHINTEVTRDKRFSTRALANPANDYFVAMARDPKNVEGKSPHDFSMQGAVTKARAKVIYGALQNRQVVTDSVLAGHVYHLVKDQIRHILYHAHQPADYPENKKTENQVEEARTAIMSHMPKGDRKKFIAGILEEVTWNLRGHSRESLVAAR